MMFWRQDSEIKYDKRDFNPEALEFLFNVDRLSTALIPDESVVLEVGCATGYISEYLRQKKRCTVIGVERNPHEAKMAEGRCHAVVCGDIDNEDTVETIVRICKQFGGVDVVLASAVLEHVLYPDRVLVNFRRVLRVGGSVVATIPNIAHWSMRWELLRGRWEYEDYGLLDRSHVRFLTFTTAQQLFKEAGYRITYYEIECLSGLRILGGLLRRSPFLRKCIELRLHRLCRSFPNVFAYQAVFQAVPNGVG